MSSSLNWESGGTSTREKLVALARRMLNRSVLASRYFHVTAAILGRFRDRARLPARYTSRMSPARRSLGAGLHGLSNLRNESAHPKHHEWRQSMKSNSRSLPRYLV